MRKVGFVTGACRGIGAHLAGVDRSVIALWLGQESVETTQIYLHANLALKEEALKKIARDHLGRAIQAGRSVAPILRNL